MAQLIAGGGGYTATVGGAVRIFGSNDVDVISLADIAGKISFDGSFNRGGDFIILPNTAKTYSIVRAGSSVTLSDADSTITIPVGSKGGTLQFADGELVLKYDGQVLLGSQTITTASATISAPLAPKTALPNPTSATGTLIMAPDEPVLVGGNVRIFGTNGADKVTIADVPGNVSFDGSFNRGGDKIVLGKFAENYSAARPNASNVTVGDNDTKLTIPLGTKGLDISFSNESRKLIYGNGVAYFGNQTLNSSTTRVESFQENIKYTQVANAFVGRLPYEKETWGPLPSVIDVDGDGYKDLIFLFNENIYTGDRLGENAGNSATAGQIRIFINKGGTGFADETSKFIDQNVVDGCANVSITVDINQDGILDVIYPTSREDGRSTVNPEDAQNQFNVLLSNTNTGKYEIVRIGLPNWNANAFSFEIDGVMYFATHGYWPVSPKQEVFYFSNGKFEIASNILPETAGTDIWQPFRIQGQAQIFKNNSSSGRYNIIQSESFTDESGKKVNGLVLYERLENKSWTYSDFYNLSSSSEYVKEISYTNWSLSREIQPLYKIAENKYAIGEIHINAVSSTLIRLYPEAEPVFITTASVRYFFSNDISGVSSINEWDLQSEGFFIALSAQNGKLSPIELNIIGIKNREITSETLKAFDYNLDGYEDLVLYEWTKNQTPVIYINNKDGTFSLIESNIPYGDIRYESIIDDFNNDGIWDIVSYVADGQYQHYDINMSTYHLFIGSTNSFVI